MSRNSFPRVFRLSPALVELSRNFPPLSARAGDYDRAAGATIINVLDFFARNNRLALYLLGSSHPLRLCLACN